MSDLRNHLPPEGESITYEAVRELLEHLPGTVVLFSNKFVAPDNRVFIQFGLQITEPTPPPNAPADLGVNVSDNLGLGEKLT